MSSSTQLKLGLEEQNWGKFGVSPTLSRNCELDGAHALPKARMPTDRPLPETICEVQIMASSTLFLKRTKQITLSLPVQAGSLVCLCMLVVWTLYFSDYPPVHNTLHGVRHHTLGVGCH